MFVSTHIRRIAGIAAVTAGFAALTPVAQAGHGFQGSPDAVDRSVAARQAELGSSFQGSPDAIDRAVATRQAEQAAAFDAREHAALDLNRGISPDVVERAVRAHELNAMPDLSSMPDAVERTAAAGQLQYAPPTTTSRFDWSDFGIGAGAGVGLMLLLGGIGALALRRSEGRVTTA
jgi:hypothetical protein